MQTETSSGEILMTATSLFLEKKKTFAADIYLKGVAEMPIL